MYQLEEADKGRLMTSCAWVNISSGIGSAKVDSDEIQIAVKLW